MSDRLFEVPARGRSAGGGVRYVCPQCWRRIELLVAPEEPPLCAACDVRTLEETKPAPAAGTAPRPAAQLDLPWE